MDKVLNSGITASIVLLNATDFARLQKFGVAALRLAVRGASPTGEGIALTWLFGRSLPHTILYKRCTFIIRKAQFFGRTKFLAAVIAFVERLLKQIALKDEEVKRDRAWQRECEYFWHVRSY